MTSQRRPFMSRTKLLWVGASLLGVLAASPTFAADAADRAFYIYQGQRRELRIDSSRFAILQPALAPGARAPAVVAGIATNDLEPHPIAGWSLVPPAVAANTLRAADPARTPRQIVAELAADPALEFVSPVFIDDVGGAMLVTPHILVGLDPALPQQRSQALLDGAGEILERNWGGMPGVHRLRPASRNGFDVLDAANALATTPGVLWAEPDMIFTGRPALIPNDPGFTSCWGINNTGQSGGVADQDMDGPEAWDITTGDPNVLVLIIDTGVDQTHPDINQVPGEDFTTDGGDGGPVNSFDNHGTAVGGCVSATINNALGTVGIAPGTRVASARPLITTNASGNWTSQASWTVNALNWAAGLGARVSNNSNSYGFTSSAIANAYTSTRNNGMVHFASAGNDNNPNSSVYPANLPTVNSVAALTRTGARASFSNGGPDPFIAAPGQSIFTTDRAGAPGYNTSDYATVDGTSFAGPYTAGVAALIISFNPFLSAEDVENIMASSAVDLGVSGFDNVFGWGFVNARAALDATPPSGPPSTFALQDPIPGQTQLSRTPLFQWASAQSATIYFFTIDDAPDFATPIFTTTLSGTSLIYSGPSLSANTTYYWGVVASNELGNADSNPLIASFTTYSIVPDSFFLSLPASGAVNVGTLTTFAWNAANLAGSYLLEVDDAADFSSPAISLTTAQTVVSPSTPLATGTLYNWRVTALNQIGSRLSSPVSQSFTTVVPPPGSFNLLSPADGPNIATSMPLLTWSPSSGASTYNVLVDNDQTFASPEVNTTGIAATSYMVPPGVLVNHTRYYWRVTAVGPGGSTLSTPSLRSFGVVVPACPGNANGDATVNFDDITSVLSNFGATGGPAYRPGDANGNGSVNFDDVTTVLSRFGNVCPS
jgi:subtilisin family serine protease